MLPPPSWPGDLASRRIAQTMLPVAGSVQILSRFRGLVLRGPISRFHVWPRAPRRAFGSPLVAGEEQAAVRGHRGLAAGGVVGQDGHHIAAARAELVAVVDPAGAVHFA